MKEQKLKKKWYKPWKVESFVGRIVTTTMEDVKELADKIHGKKKTT